MKLFTSLIFIINLISISCVYALDKYAGFAVGPSTVNQSMFSATGSGHKIFGGIRLDKNYAIEAAHVDLGVPYEDFQNTRYEYRIWELGMWAKGYLPVKDNIELFAKGGIVYWDLKTTETRYIQSSTQTVNTGTDFGWGAGITFSSCKGFGLQIEYEQTKVNNNTAAMWSLAGIYQF